MFIYNNVEINYSILGEKGEWILFLHGWGGSENSFLGIAHRFKNKRCLLIDFPPFGKSGEPSEVWTLATYADMVFELLKMLKIKNLKIISHSFGGRVAILLCSNYNINVEKLILVDSAGMKPRTNLAVKFKIAKFKIFKRLGFNQINKGSQDYKALSPIMKQTFSKIVGLHLEKFCLNIKAQTLIVFGEKDTATPLYMARRLNKLIAGSGLVILKGAGHFSYIDNFDEFMIVAKKFIG